MKYKPNEYEASYRSEMILRDMIDEGIIDSSYTLDALLRWLSRDNIEKFFEDFMRDLDIEIVETDEELEDDE